MEPLWTESRGHAKDLQKLFHINQCLLQFSLKLVGSGPPQQCSPILGMNFKCKTALCNDSVILNRLHLQKASCPVAATHIEMLSSSQLMSDQPINTSRDVSVTKVDVTCAT